MKYETFDAWVLLANTQKNDKDCWYFISHTDWSLMETLHPFPHKCPRCFKLVCIQLHCCASLSIAHPTGSPGLNGPCMWTVRLVHYQCTVIGQSWQKERKKKKRIKKKKRKEREEKKRWLLQQPDSWCYDLFFFLSEPQSAESLQPTRSFDMFTVGSKWDRRGRIPSKHHQAKMRKWETILTVCVNCECMWGTVLIVFLCSDLKEAFGCAVAWPRLCRWHLRWQFQSYKQGCVYEQMFLKPICDTDQAQAKNTSNQRWPEEF